MNKTRFDQLAPGDLLLATAGMLCKPIQSFVISRTELEITVLCEDMHVESWDLDEINESDITSIVDSEWKLIEYSREVQRTRSR